MRKVSVVILIILCISVCIGGFCIWNIGEKEEKVDKENEEVYDKCIVYFNPVVPVEISEHSIISKISEEIENLQLEECQEEITVEGSTTIEFYKDKVVKKISISGEYVFIDSKQYKAEKEKITELIEYLEKVTDIE